MSKFANKLKKYDTTGRTINVKLPELGPDAYIEVLPANSTNKPYFNAILRYGGKEHNVPKQITVKDIRQNRIDEAEIMAQHLCVGWTGVTDDKGNDVPFNQGNCLELLQDLIDMAPMAFDRIREESGTDSKFFLDDEEVDELAKK